MSTAAAALRNRVRLALDIVMALSFALLLNARVFSGLSFHEILGTVIGAFFVVHLLLNASWVIETTRRLLASGVPRRVRTGYLLNGLLLVSMAVIGITGVLVSRVVFPWLHGPMPRWVRGTHITLAFLILAAVGVHVGMHWGWIVSVTRRVVSGWSRLWRLGAVLTGGLVVVLLASGGIPAAGPVPVDRIDAGPSGPVVTERGSDAVRDLRGRRGMGRRSANALGVAAYYLGPLGLFAATTVWVERRGTSRTETGAFEE